MASTQTDSSSEAKAPARNLWASAQPPAQADVRQSTLWRVFINSKTVDGDRRCVEQFDMSTALPGWGALGEIQRGICARGYTLNSAWELGSDRGFVAWVGIDVDELFEAGEQA
ncbi:MAG: hypothetical protein EPN48_11745 [Microbacteriaceae bacterium]|nr:MAG: hypothetical protein EPN48_11745 [Microbacteriaceae bacterium]